MSGVLENLLVRAASEVPRIVKNQILTAFEPDAAEPKGRRGHVSATTRLLRATAHDEVRRFSSPKRAEDVLRAAQLHLSDLDDHEELIVAFGKRTSRGPVFEGVWRGVGHAGGVSFTPLARDLVQKMVTTVHGAYFVVIHNHPPNDLKTLLSLFLDWVPLPSSGDREVALRNDVATLRRFLQTGHDGSFKWYLVDESQIKEFFLPSVERFEQLFAYITSREKGSPFDFVQGFRILFL